MKKTNYAFTDKNKPIFAEKRNSGVGMKIILYKLSVLFTVLVLLVSCSKPAGPADDGSSSEETSANGQNTVYNVDSNLYWDFLNLYDNAEIEGTNSLLALDSLGGESLKFYSPSGEEITDLSTRIFSDCVIEKLDKDGQSVAKFTVKITGDADDSSAVTEDKATQQDENSVNSTSESTLKQPIELKLLAPLGSQAIKNAAAEYEKKHSDVKITVVEKDFDKKASVINYLKDKKQSGSFYDAVIINGKYLSSAAENGLIADISSLLPQNISDSFTKSCFDGVKSGDGILALPLEGTVSCFTSNPDILSYLSLSNPDNFDSLAETCKKIADSNDSIFPIGISVKQEYYDMIGELFFSSVRSQGCSFEKDGQAAFDAQDYEKFIASIKKLKDENLISDEWSFSQLIGGRTAFGFAKNTAYKNLYGSSAKYNFTSKLLSETIKESYISALDISAIAVTKTDDEERLKAACDFVKYLALSAKDCAEYCSSRSTIPALLKAQSQEQFNTDDWKNYIKQLEQSECVTSFEEKNVLLRYIYDAVESSVSENGNISDDFKLLVKRINDRLAK